MYSQPDHDFGSRPEFDNYNLSFGRRHGFRGSRGVGYPQELYGPLSFGGPRNDRRANRFCGPHQISEKSSFEGFHGLGKQNGLYNPCQFSNHQSFNDYHNFSGYHCFSPRCYPHIPLSPGYWNNQRFSSWKIQRMNDYFNLLEAKIRYQTACIDNSTSMLRFTEASDDARASSRLEHEPKIEEILQQNPGIKEVVDNKYSELFRARYRYIRKLQRMIKKMYENLDGYRMTDFPEMCNSMWRPWEVDMCKQRPCDWRRHHCWNKHEACKKQTEFPGQYQIKSEKNEYANPKKVSEPDFSDAVKNLERSNKKADMFPPRRQAGTAISESVDIPITLQEAWNTLSKRMIKNRVADANKEANYDSDSEISDEPIQDVIIANENNVAKSE